MRHQLGSVRAALEDSAPELCGGDDNSDQDQAVQLDTEVVAGEPHEDAAEGGFREGFCGGDEQL